ncbi:unnamed protein product [Sphagnum jensenii]|uniref:LOB domain-containing protein n=1 Tax=Sphagnum jensenii TaxID=128206 RepID=A0ABP1B204_9BRYO
MSPCAACKLLRRRCAKGCVFAPYFPPDEPQKFANVHKVFGASNVNKMLKDLPVHQRGDAVSSMVYEANARVRDPVYGCVGAISSLQQQVIHLQAQLTVANAKILSMQMHNQSSHAGPNVVGSLQGLQPGLPTSCAAAAAAVNANGLEGTTPINAPCKMDSMWT